MLYPVYMNKDEDSAYSVTVPDFPGCFSAVDDMKDLPAMVQEAVELFFENEDLVVPDPTALEDLQDLEGFQGGTWVFVDIDLNKLDTRKERINLSIPVWALREIDDFAKATQATRSGLMVSAAIDRIRDTTRNLKLGGVIAPSVKSRKASAKKKVSAGAKRKVVRKKNGVVKQAPKKKRQAIID